MLATSPQFLYVILVLPTLFGLVLLGEGISKVVQQEWYGLINLFFGILFLCIVALAYVFFSAYVNI